MPPAAPENGKRDAPPAQAPAGWSTSTGSAGIGVSTQGGGVGGALGSGVGGGLGGSVGSTLGCGVGVGAGVGDALGDGLGLGGGQGGSVILHASSAAIAARRIEAMRADLMGPFSLGLPALP